MVEITSDIRFDISGFAFRKAAGFDNSRYIGSTTPLAPEFLPSLAYLPPATTFNSLAGMWDGPSDVRLATDLYTYAGLDLRVNGSGFPISGTVTAFFIATPSGAASIIGASIDAARIDAACQNSATREDDFAILREVFASHDTARLSAFADVFYAQTGNDTVLAGEGNDVIAGMQGRDQLFGQAGDDQLFGGYGNDFMSGGAGLDVLRGEDGDDRLLGLSGVDRLTGDAGNDSLEGGAGQDTLIGGAGRDLLDGGADIARDVFVFNAPSDSVEFPMRDTIRNFVSRIDDIDLSAIDANAALDGDQAFLFSGVTPQANSVWFEPSVHGVFVRVELTGDTNFDMTMRVAFVESLVARDFIL